MQDFVERSEIKSSFYHPCWSTISLPPGHPPGSQDKRNGSGHQNYLKEFNCIALTEHALKRTGFHYGLSFNHFRLQETSQFGAHKKIPPTNPLYRH